MTGRVDGSILGNDTVEIAREGALLCQVAPGASEAPPLRPRDTGWRRGRNMKYEECRADGRWAADREPAL